MALGLCCPNQPAVVFFLPWTASPDVLRDRGSGCREAVQDRGADLLFGALEVEVAGADSSPGSLKRCIQSPGKRSPGWFSGPAHISTRLRRGGRAIVARFSARGGGRCAGWRCLLRHRAQPLSRACRCGGSAIRLRQLGRHGSPVLSNRWHLPARRRSGGAKPPCRDAVPGRWAGTLGNGHGQALLTAAKSARVCLTMTESPDRF